MKMIPNGISYFFRRSQENWPIIALLDYAEYQHLFNKPNNNNNKEKN